MARHRQSAGLLMYRRGTAGLEVFLVHPGGPFFAKKDAGYWSVPKGEFAEAEIPLEVAHREFREETGLEVETCAENDRRIPLGTVVQRGGKTVHAWAFEGDWPEGTALKSNTFRLAWPPRSGRHAEFPEVDRAGFFDLETARGKINDAQDVFLRRLDDYLHGRRHTTKGE